MIMAVITEWPAMILVRADAIKEGDVIYGRYGIGGLTLWDESETVTSVSRTIDGDVRIEAHESDGVTGFALHYPANRLIIGKGE